MFKHQLHNWLLSFILLASLTSFSSYASNNAIVVNQTELLDLKTPTRSNPIFYVAASNKIVQTYYKNRFYGFSFHFFLSTKTNSNKIKFTSQQFAYHTFKAKQLDWFYKPLKNQYSTYYLMF